MYYIENIDRLKIDKFYICENIWKNISIFIRCIIFIHFFIRNIDMVYLNLSSINANIQNITEDFEKWNLLNSYSS